MCLFGAVDIVDRLFGVYTYKLTLTRARIVSRLCRRLVS